MMQIWCPGSPSCHVPGMLRRLRDRGGHLRCPDAACAALIDWRSRFGKSLEVEPADAPIGADDEGQRQRVPVAVVELLPGAAVIAAEVGAVGAGGDPDFEGLAPLHGRAVAVRRSGGRRPVLAAI